MAEALLVGAVVGAVVGDAVSKLSTLIIQVIQKSLHFKSKLTEIQNTIEMMKPLFNDIEKLDAELDRRREETDNFINMLKGAHKIVRNCEHIRYNLWHRYRQASKLDDFNKSLLKFTQIYVPLVVTRDVREVLVEVRGNSGNSVGCSRVPLLDGSVVGFDDQVRDLKAMVLTDNGGDECSVVVVSAAGGCGKTTLVKMVCREPEIKAQFGENIYFVTISSSPNLTVIIKSLLKRHAAYNQLDFKSEEVAIQQWGMFLEDNKSPVLLVLDDVWSHFIIMKFMLNSPGYKILVTSRTAFTQFNIFKLQLLNHQAAINLFSRSAFSEHIENELVEKLVECCKNHPLALIVIGGMLNGAPVASWETMYNEIYTGEKLIWDLNEFILLTLEKSLDVIDEPEIKECYLDLGLFPEDQRVAATTLMDMWVHLYNHNKDGSNTVDKLFRLSNKNLATWLPIRKHLPAIANHCEEESITQHDMLRTLAIRLSSQQLIQKRERLILNPYGKNIPKTFNARLLSISTDESSEFRWKSLKFPKVEVFVLNFMSKTHPLPKFMKNMKKLKVLIITNYGYYFSELKNFPAPKMLSGLTTIRLDHVSIGSISSSILGLVNLQKLSLIMCKIGNSFDKSVPNKLTNLMEIEIDSCDDLVTFPSTLCNLVNLKKLSITNCHELTSLTEDFGKLLDLEVLRLASCSKLVELPESITDQKLRIIDLSNCLSLCKLPFHIGKLGDLRIMDVSGCTGLQKLPESVKDLHRLKVVCDDEIRELWRDLKNVELEVINEDVLGTFSKIISRGYGR